MFLSLLAVLTGCQRFLLVLLSCNSIGSLLRALGRVVRSHQEARIAETQVPEVAFNIMSDARFKKARQAVSDNVAAVGRLGSSKRRKRMDVPTLHDEAAMLALSTYTCTTAKGCSMRFAYFCTRNFFIRGPAELHELTDLDLTLGKDEYGDFLRYDFWFVTLLSWLSASVIFRSSIFLPAT